MKKIKFQTVLLVLGIALVLAAAVLLIVRNRNIDRYQERAQSYVNTLREIMPPPQDAVPEERRNNTMSVLSVDGVDFAGILEMPRYGSALAVCADWGNTTRYPCCFYGSIYDGSLQIGATAREGQFDFYGEISLGDAVVFTDAEGNRYELRVTGIRSEKRIDRSTLCREEATLTLFIEKTYSFEYLVVYCDAVC